MCSFDRALMIGVVVFMFAVLAFIVFVLTISVQRDTELRTACGISAETRGRGYLMPRLRGWWRWKEKKRAERAAEA